MSTFSRRITGALITVTVAAMLSAGPPAAAGVPGLPGLEDPDFEIPTVGECHNYGLARVSEASDPSAVVPCGTTHTAKVIATPGLPEGVTWSSSPSTINLVMIKACLPAFRSILGRTERTRQKSAYDIAWYEPTQTQKEAGARWLRCDLVLLGGGSLQPITRNVAPILPAAPLPKSVASCLVGTDPVRPTVCSKRHHYRATGTWLVDRNVYPGHDGLFAIAKNHCPSLVSTPRYWYALWMSSNSWKAGDRTITCYSHTFN